MSHELTVIAVVAVGAQLAVQAPINGGLGRTVGRLPAALVSFLVGLFLLIPVCLAFGNPGNFSSIGDASLPTLFGGLIGATYVAVATVTISRIGAGAVAAATIAGQLTSAVVIDAFGWVGVELIPVSGLRIAGAVLLLLGTLLVVYRKKYVDDVEGAGKAGVLAVLAMTAAGMAVGFQHPMNAELAGHIGGLNATLVNFSTGLVLLLAVVLGTRSLGQVRRVTEVRWYYLLGGLIGLITVLASLSAVETIGAAGLTAALVTGQLLSSIALDRFGAFGMEKRLVTPLRVAGVILLIAGTFLTVT
ncbi:MAG: DMT family transporter [Solirubrobacterales bacterium]